MVDLVMFHGLSLDVENSYIIPYWLLKQDNGTMSFSPQCLFLLINSCGGFTIMSETNLPVIPKHQY